MPDEDANRFEIDCCVNKKHALNFCYTVLLLCGVTLLQYIIFDDVDAHFWIISISFIILECFLALYLFNKKPMPDQDDECRHGDTADDCGESCGNCKHTCQMHSEDQPCDVQNCNCQGWVD